MAGKYITINGHDLFYEIKGKGNNSIIFIHGLCGNHKVWYKNIPAFASKYKVLAIDIFGHGNSSKEISPKWAFESMASVIKKLIEKEGLQRVVLIGHSIAGNILLNCMEENPRNVVAYVFVDCPFNATERVVNSRNKLAGTLLANPPHQINTAIMKWYKTMMDMNASSDDNNLILSSLKNLDAKWALDFAKTTNFVRKVPQIWLPILIFESDWLTKDEPERSFTRALPHANYFHWPVSNHFFFVYQAGKFNKILQEFLDKNLPE